MADYAYQEKKGKEVRTARARVTGVNASYKDLCNVCRNVRGWNTEDALEFLELASIGEKAILFTRHNHGKGHRRELGGKKGGWPVKSAKLVLGVLQNASANAAKLGLGSTKVAHIIANKQDTFPRMSPKGRRIRHDYETAFIEIVLEEAQESAAKSKGGKKKADAKGAVEKQPAAAAKIEAKKPADSKEQPEAKKAEAGQAAAAAKP
jgi:large subunit ribosomal protein L17e